MKTKAWVAPNQLVRMRSAVQIRPELQGKGLFYFKREVFLLGGITISGQRFDHRISHRQSKLGLRGASTPEPRSVEA